MTERSTIKELQALRALAMEMLKRTSRLEEGLADVDRRTPRKGKKLEEIDPALVRRARMIARRTR